AFQSSGVEGFLQFIEPGELQRQRVLTGLVVNRCFRKAIKYLTHLGQRAALRPGNSARGAAADALLDDRVVVHLGSIPRSSARRSRSRVTPLRCPTSLLSSARICATTMTRTFRDGCERMRVDADHPPPAHDPVNAGHRPMQMTAVMRLKWGTTGGACSP